MTFLYFGYGSNMERTSLRAKGVAPLASLRATLPGWRLRFNVQHFFLHEGGVGNIEPCTEAGSAVQGVLHRCEDHHLALLDDAEAYGHGYDRIEVAVSTAQGPQRAIAYVGIPSFLNEHCRPTQRYLNILLKGAQAAGLDAAYIEALRSQPVHVNPPVAPFEPPAGVFPVFTAQTLTLDPPLTALAGSVFDMSPARWQHDFLKGYFGGKDMTLFHLRRMDQSDGHECLDDLRHDRLSWVQRAYLDAYLHAYNAEYRYVGRFSYD
ncbi:MAG: gamma-glutamylcyclotransferase family protein [Leptothrix ochracea]|uniref:gamma-glutamylcyclotransferase family protein n=1 Tax=Leptothrix ochracea TaxID=735331 RepID=UPI0034E19591